MDLDLAEELSNEPEEPMTLEEHKRGRSIRQVCTYNDADYYNP